MKYTLTIIFSFLICNFSIAQHTLEFDKIASKIKPIETKVVDIKFKNGNQKEKGTNIIYEFGDYEYTYITGQRIEYYKSGQIMTESEYDLYGNILSCKLYDGNGDILRESKTLKIDTKAKTIEEFLHLNKYYEILTYEKKYKYSFKLCKWYLFSEGQMLNNKKIGKWKKYSDDGKIKKETKY